MLLGATGTGKSATTAWLIEQVQRPTLVMAPNKTLAAQLANEFRELLPNNAVEYFVSYYDYYQPEAYIPQTDTYIEKDSSINDEVERLRHSATNSLLTRRDVIVVASVSCIYGLGTPQEYVDRMVRLRVGAADRARRPAAQVRPDAVHPQRPGLHPRHLPGPRRHGGDHPGLRGAGHPHRVLRRRDRADLHPAPAHRRGGRARSRRCTSSRPPTTSPAPSGWSARSGGSSSSWSDRLAELERQGKLLEAQRLRMRTTYDIEMMRQVGSCTRHRELLAAHRRPRARVRAQLPARLLPRGLPAGHRRVAPDRPADRRDVRRRHVPQADAGRPRLPAAQRHGQPAAEVGGVPRAHRADRLPVGDAGRPTSWPSHGSPVEQIIRPTGLVDPEVVAQADQGPDRRPAARDPAPH